ncbi:MAG: hypothetical protein OXT67_10375 [Zetaproteobacteria bacterium]|nr:hypothetical protein [Zetaproteobacteria bacterium]
MQGRDVTAQENIIRVVYLDLTRQVDMVAMRHEQKVRNICAPHFRVVHSTAQVPTDGVDILIARAAHLPEPFFWPWLRRLELELNSTRTVPLPALILADIHFAEQVFMWRLAVQSNWYFDVVTEQNLDSIPLRMANLVRIHDHLYESRRYQETLAELTEQVSALERKLAQKIDGV